ncbi:MAG: hypothetical protein FJ295_15535 [Planctomycetes bacterium]|nr:hypothetical protein [Planctomycetota bacterium]
MGRSKSNREPSLALRVLVSLAPWLRPSKWFNWLILAALLVATIAVWRSWAPVVLGDRRYQLRTESIEITPQPAWIRSNVREEVVEANDLASHSALDPQITVTVARAFSVHSWVARVRSVRKEYPARVVVELEYRRPVGMVMVRRDDGNPGVIPVDASAIVLPTDDFERQGEAESPVRNYLRIHVGDTRHHGPTGTVWGDERVAAAARIAEQLSESWQALGLHRIELAEESSGNRAEDLLFDLVAKEDRRYFWGHAPGKERASELDASEKLELLQELARVTPAGGNRIDLRSKTRLPLQSRRLEENRTSDNR